MPSAEVQALDGAVDTMLAAARNWEVLIGDGHAAQRVVDVLVRDPPLRPARDRAWSKGR
ncbi:MAG: hypothetical protein AB2A00_17490 [Myxococcota bacterium]